MFRTDPELTPKIPQTFLSAKGSQCSAERISTSFGVNSKKSAAMWSIETQRERPLRQDRQPARKKQRLQAHALKIAFSKCLRIWWPPTQGLSSAPIIFLSVRQVFCRVCPRRPSSREAKTLYFGVSSFALILSMTRVKLRVVLE